MKSAIRLILSCFVISSGYSYLQEREYMDGN